MMIYGNKQTMSEQTTPKTLSDQEEEMAKYVAFFRNLKMKCAEVDDIDFSRSVYGQVRKIFEETNDYVKKFEAKK